jgi:CTP:phosphocholine cytidylyltransferase-like protein
MSEQYEFNAEDMQRLSNAYSDLKIRYSRLKNLYLAGEVIANSSLQQANIILNKTIVKLRLQISEFISKNNILSEENTKLSNKLITCQKELNGVRNSRDTYFKENLLLKKKTDSENTLILQQKLAEKNQMIKELNEKIIQLQQENKLKKTQIGELTIQANKFKKLQSLLSETTN